MREQIRNIFKNVMNEEFVQDVEGVVHSIDKDGKEEENIKGQLLKVSQESILGIAQLKKAYLHRKALLTKIAAEVQSQADEDEKAGLKEHVQNMMSAIDERIKKFDEDTEALQKEVDQINTKQV